MILAPHPWAVSLALPMALRFLRQWKKQSRSSESERFPAAVETDAGIHFIRVDDRVAGESADFAALRAELEASIQRSNAEQELLVAVDALRDLSFNAGPTLAGRRRR